MDPEIKLSPKDIRTVQDRLWPARHKWKRIGIAIGIDTTTIEVIRMDNRRTDDCFMEILTEWLRNNPMPCWKSLMAALKSINIEVLLGMSLQSIYTRTPNHLFIVESVD